MQRQHNRSPYARASFLGLWLVALGGVLPFVVLLRYAHPALDDFAYAEHYKTLGFWAAQQQLYTGWTGRYVSSALLGAANPLSYDWLAGQGWAGASVLLLWWSALLLLARELLQPAIGWWQAALGATLVLALSLAQFPSPAEGLYWLAGAYTYIVPSAMTIGLLAVLLRYYRVVGRARVGWYCLAAVLVLGIMGGNEINGLLLLVALLVAALLGGFARQLWPLVAIAALGAGIAWGAPGNTVRMHAMPDRLPLWGAITHSAGAAAYCVQAWFGSGVLPLAGILLVGWLHRGVQPWPTVALHRLTRQPWLLTALLLGLLALSFIPGYWATGLPIPRRARNADFMLFVIGWLLTLYSWLSWYAQRFPVRSWPRPLAAVLWGWLLLAVATDHNLALRHDQMGTSLSALAQAYYDWGSGAAATYDQQQRARYTYLRRLSVPATPVRLDPLRSEPPTLFYSDISADATLWGNTTYAHFFNCSAVYVAPAPQ